MRDTTSAADDYCDVCGAPIESSATPQSTAPAPDCVKQGVPRVRGAGQRPVLRNVRTRFGAARRRRPTVQTGRLRQWDGPPSSQPTGSSMSACLARGGPDTVDFPQFFPERRITLQGNTALIGRHNRDQGVEPEIDLGIEPIDRGVSTQHAVLRIRDSGLTVTDLGSTNGTSLNGSDDLLRQWTPKPHSPTEIAYTSARGPRSRSR